MVGTRDTQTVRSDGTRAVAPRIDGVKIIRLANIITRSGVMTEVFRTDWNEIGIAVRQVNWVALSPGAVTDWHMHELQTDHLVAVNGPIKLALWDGRTASPTFGAQDIIRFGAAQPCVVIVPPGVWHGLRNESGAPAGYLNIVDQTFCHEDPDSYRSSPGSGDMPDIL
jgi:dTDP-4-dehydrorhamnose 3,5-epimerase